MFRARGVGIGGVNLTLSPDAVEELVERVVKLVLERLDSDASPWSTRKEAAAYLHLPLSRLERDKTIPVHRHGARVLYHRPELDQFLLEA